MALSSQARSSPVTPYLGGGDGSSDSTGPLRPADPRAGSTDLGSQFRHHAACRLSVAEERMNGFPFTTRPLVDGRQRPYSAGGDQ